MSDSGARPLRNLQRPKVQSVTMHKPTVPRRTGRVERPPCVADGSVPLPLVQSSMS